MHLLFLKLKQKKNMKKHLLLRFLFQPIFSHFFSVLAFKTIDTQMLFRSVFFKTQKKPVINRQKQPKWRF